MFCTKCGQSFPDGSAACPFCGQPVAPIAPTQPVAPVAPVAAPVAPAAPIAPAAPVDPNAYAQPQQPVYQQPVAAPVAPKAPSWIKYDFGGFFKDFFKSPFDAISSRDNRSHFLLGLTFPVFILIMNLIFNLACKSRAAAFNLMAGGTWWNTSYGKTMMGTQMTTPRAFVVFFTELFAFASLFLIIFALYKAFKVKKVDILGTLSWVGLAFCPYAVLNVISWLCTQIYFDPKGDGFGFINFGPLFAIVGFVFVFIALYDYFLSKKEATGTKTSAMCFALVSCGIFKLAEFFFGFLLVKMCL